MPDVEAKLREFIEKHLNHEEVELDEKRKNLAKGMRNDWAYGALIFARELDLIDWSTYDALFDEYFWIK